MKNMNYEIIDNFLPDSEYRIIKNLLNQPDFCWNYRSSQTQEFGVETTQEVPYFYHTFYEHPYISEDIGMNVINPLLERIGSNILLHVRANLTVKQSDDDFCLPHCDEYTKTLTHKTSVFMLTNCNSKTVLKNVNGKDVEVLSVENRLLSFDANITHFVKYQTDTKKRMIININHMRA